MNEIREKVIEKINIELKNYFDYVPLYVSMRLADKLIEAGLIFDPETDLRAKFKKGDEAWHVVRTIDTEEPLFIIKVKVISAPKSLLLGAKYDVTDIEDETCHYFSNEDNLYATEAEALAALEQPK